MTKEISTSPSSRATDAFVKKVSEGMGGFFELHKAKRLATAGVEAAIVSAQGEPGVGDLQRRAMFRFLEEESRRQQNIEGIAAKALPHIKEDAKPENMDDDWVTNFFEKSRIVSDEEMQGLWSRVLAGEANSPRTYSKRTVNFLADLDKKDAALFTKLCGFVWNIGAFIPLLFKLDDKIVESQGIDFDSLNHLQSIGLITFSAIAKHERQNLNPKFVVFYYGEPYFITMPIGSHRLPTGHVLLTQIGVELSALCGSKPIEGMTEYVIENWKRALPNLEVGRLDVESASFPRHIGSQGPFEPAKG